MNPDTIVDVPGEQGVPSERPLSPRYLREVRTLATFELRRIWSTTHDRRIQAEVGRILTLRALQGEL